ncbi:cardiolipin synthase [Candidatus Pacearchaeota archaeon]|nr:cardiolipin synthase [Candidatus Pacearchaeota archaeon]MBD3283241.1 cardiolipin synthase [Candidatus Pacearchaeota archaeon]
METSTLLVIAYYVYLFIAIVYVVTRNKETPSTFAWIFLIAVFPVLGFVLYVLIGRKSLRTSKKQKINEKHFVGSMKRILSGLFKQQKKAIELIEKRKDLEYKDKLFQLLYRNSESILTLRNRVKILRNGREKFPMLFKDIKNAKRFIHMQYFIWRSDELTEKFKELLIKKAKQGVEIRILYDWFGSMLISRKSLREMRRSGIKIYPYKGPGDYTFFHTLNYRDHSKIAIIDGKIGYNGGMNMGREYLDGSKKFPYWRDTHLRIKGSSAKVLQTIFGYAWKAATRESLFKREYYPRMEIKSFVPIQITSSRVETGWSSIEQLYFQLINTAEKKVYIQSPYFVPNESIYTSLITAALSGLDVRLLITGIPDKKIPYWAAFTYFEELLNAGVKIYHYKKGFMHSKTINIDTEICSIGTANMDVRSLKLNHEINTLIYDRKISKQLERDLLKDIEDSKEFTLNDYRKINPLKKFRNSVARLLAPLL